MATNHKKHGQKRTYIVTRTLIEDAAIVGTLYPNTVFFLHFCTQWEGGPGLVAHEPHARPRTRKLLLSTLYSFWSTTINFSIHKPWNELYTSNERWVLVLINYYNISSSTYICKLSSVFELKWRINKKKTLVVVIYKLPLSSVNGWKTILYAVYVWNLIYICIPPEIIILHSFLMIFHYYRCSLTFVWTLTNLSFFLQWSAYSIVAIAEKAEKDEIMKAGMVFLLR
jgi:hypothetical protein